MTSPVERISGPSRESTSGKRAKGSTASFTLTWSVRYSERPAGGSRPWRRRSSIVSPTITRVGQFGHGHPRGLGHEGDGSARPGIGLEDVDLPVLGGELHVEQTPDIEGPGQGACVTLDLGDHLGRQALGRERAGRVAGVDARLLDVLHHAADDHLSSTVADGVDVDLHRVLQEAVHEDGALGGHPSLPAEGPSALSHQAGHHVAHGPVVVHDLHGPAAEHVARANEHRVTNLGRDGDRLLGRRRRPTVGLANPEVSAQLVPSPPVLRRIDALGARAEDELRVDGMGELERGLAAERDDDAGEPPVARRGPPLGVENILHIFCGQWLEVEPVGGVVVGRDGLGVAVHHHRLVARLPQRHARHGRSSSRTRSPARCGSAPTRGSPPGDAPRARPRPRPRRSRSDRACRPRTPRRTCRPSCTWVQRRPPLWPGARGPRRRRGRRRSGRRRSPGASSGAGPGRRGRRGCPRGRESETTCVARGCVAHRRCGRSPGGTRGRCPFAGGSPRSTRRDAVSVSISKSRSGVATAMRSSSASSDSDSSSASPGSAFNPARPCSSERIAFCSDSPNVRPMAMTSPTDCMLVPSRTSAPGSFSNAHLGILVTT